MSNLDSTYFSDINSFLYSALIHDLRSPVSSLEMVLQLLKNNIKREDMDQDLYEMLETAFLTAQNLTKMLDNSLDFIKGESYLKDGEQKVNLIELINDLLEINKIAIEQKKINIELNVENVENTNIYVNKEVLKICMRNLITNSIKYSYEGGLIKIFIEEKESLLVFSICDRGCGITNDDQRKIKENKCDSSVLGTQREEGSGLGLFIVKNLLEKLGGKLWFESQLGIGSTFYFSVPKIIKK